MFGGLPIVILMGDFYQFSHVIGYLLWDKVCTKKDYYGKMLCRNFNIVITFTQQMHQINDPKFNALLRRARTNSLTNANITNFNSKITADFLFYDLSKNMVIV